MWRTHEAGDTASFSCKIEMYVLQTDVRMEIRKREMGNLVKNTDKLSQVFLCSHTKF